MAISPEIRVINQSKTRIESLLSYRFTISLIIIGKDDEKTHNFSTTDCVW